MPFEWMDERPHARCEAEEIARAQLFGRRKRCCSRGGVLIGGRDLLVEEILVAVSTQCAGAVEVGAPGICAPANARMLSSSAPVDLHSMVVWSCARP